MADDRMMTPADVVAKAMASGGSDLLRDAVGLIVRELMEVEVAQLTGAGRGERDARRVTQLNGYRQRSCTTCNGAQLSGAAFGKTPAQSSRLEVTTPAGRDRAPKALPDPASNAR